MAFEGILVADLCTFTHFRARIKVAHVGTDRIAIYNESRVFEIWQLGRSQPVGVCKGHEGLVINVVGLDSDLVASSAFDDTVRIWMGSKCARVIETRADRIVPLSDHRFATFSFYSMRVWNISGELLVECSQPSLIRDMIASGKQTLTVSFGTCVKAHDARTGRRLATLEHGPSKPDTLFAMPNKRLAVMCKHDTLVRVWCLNTEALLRVIDVGKMFCTPSMFPNGTLAVVKKDRLCVQDLNFNVKILELPWFGGTLIPLTNGQSLCASPIGLSLWE
jgi:WD40 repeat protein